MKIALLLLHLLVKMAPIFRNLDIYHPFLPLKAATIGALTVRDALGMTATADSWSDIFTLTLAALLIGLLLWPKPRAAALSARQE